MDKTTKAKTPHQNGTVEGEETSSQFSAWALDGDDRPKTVMPAQEIVVVDSLGKQIRKPCNHAKIPGLDADFCKVCRTYYINQQIRDSLLTRRSSSL